MKKKLPHAYSDPEDIEVGDVITSPVFVFAYEKNGDLYIEYKQNKNITEKIIHRKLLETERLKIAAETGNPDPPKSEPLDIGSYDPTRAQKKFIVLSVDQESETTCDYGPYDGFTTILSANITARRLNEDGTFNPKGEEIFFKVERWNSTSIRPKNITKVGKMKNTYIKVDENEEE